jgi:hypothetical protein
MLTIPPGREHLLSGPDHQDNSLFRALPHPLPIPAAARETAKDAIRGYLESLRNHGDEIPLEQGEPVTERVLVSLSRA